MKTTPLTAGQRFGRWTIMERAGSDKGGNAMGICRCDHGTERVIRGSNLTSGETNPFNGSSMPAKEPTATTPARKPARKPIADKQARNAAAAAHDQIDLLKARLAKLEQYTDRIAAFVDDHLAGLV
jgi:hypothetical protein